jgi:hypothetical protein
LVLKRPLTSSEARLLIDIDASFNIFYKPIGIIGIGIIPIGIDTNNTNRIIPIGKMIIDSQSEVPDPPVLHFPDYLHSVVVTP